MNNSRHAESPVGISPADIYFVIFRHKWKIIILSLLGFAAAAAYYYTKQPPYQSEAELLIRYVADTRNVNPSENSSRVTSLIDLADSVMNSEMEILSTFDLAAQVATNVGPARILAKLGGGSDPMQAAGVVRSGIKILPAHGSSVIHIIFRHPDPTIVQPVLSEIINQYLEEHVSIHNSVGFSDDLLTEETVQLRAQISQTEDELRIAKTNAGIISVPEEEKAYSDENARIREELFKAEAELAERQVAYAQLSGQPIIRPVAAGTNSVALTADQTNVPPVDLDKYKSACMRLKFLENRREDFLSNQGYTEDNKLVKENQGLIAQVTNVKTNLESKYPWLVPIETTSVVSNSPAGEIQTADPITLLTLSTRIKTLHDQLTQVQGDAAALDSAQAKIADLERKKQIQEGNYQYYANNLEQKHIDSDLGPGKISNIKTIQQPSPPSKDYGKFYKNVGSMAVGGVAFGLGLAFLIEFFLDRTIKRPVDIQNKLKIPFFLSIPDLGRRRSRLLASGRKELAYRNSRNGENTSQAVTLPNNASRAEVTSWEINRKLESYYDALRDRLVIYFESINLTRTPKLVAVTSTDKGAGVSTIAAGLAASLSETGDGRVLLVDMNAENGAAQQFFLGQPGCKLDDALEAEKRDTAKVQENLYLVSEGSITEKLPRALPKRFASLIPKLKASDYDYIIFDMPPVSPTSITTRLAGFMDSVLLVVESEKTDLQIVKQASDLLAQSKANVTAVLNKTHQYVPERLHRDFLSDVK
jgi:uncharacterized protein involved in exopolysaccharide biosynthesis/Mrp family chromosome partitioning ATPase